MLKDSIRDALDDPKSKWFWYVNDLLAIVTLLSVIMIFLETMPSLTKAYGEGFVIFEYIITAIFTVDYFAHIYVAKRKLSYLLSFYGIIDLLAILPTFLLLTNLQFLKVLRVARLLRLLRMLRLLKVIRLVKQRLDKKKATQEMLKMNLIIYICAFITLTLVFSVILFEIENGVSGTQIHTIGDAMWSTVAALTSVGFGDTFPVSGLGRLWLGLTMFTGVGFLSFAVLTMGRFFQEILFGENIEDEV